MLLPKHTPITIYDIWGFDCENDSDTGEFKCGVIWRGEGDYDIYHNPEKMAKVLNNPHPGVVVTGLNIAYDLNVLHPYFYQNRLERGGKVITCDMKTYCNGRKSKANASPRNRYLKFIDIGNFLQNLSLKQAAKKFNTGVLPDGTKGDGQHMDIHDWHNPRIELACVSHAASGAIILRKLQTMFNSMGVSMQLTSSSTALNLFQNNYLKYQIWGFQDNMEEIKIFSNLSYYGGRTDLFYRGRVDNIRCIDIVSSYPAVMMNHPYPNMNNARLTKINRLDYPIKRVLDMFEGCIDCSVHVPGMHIPILPYKDPVTKKLTFPTGNFRGVWTIPELRYATLHGVEITRVHGTLLCKNNITDFFDSYVTDIYKYKQINGTKEAAKLLLNGLSGKFGQKGNDSSSYEVVDSGDIIDTEKYYEMDGLIYAYINPGNILSFKSSAYPLIVAYITSYARIRLHEQMINLGVENVLYTDTDSVIYRDVGQPILHEGNELGDWETKFQGTWEGRSLKNYRHRDLSKKTYYEYVSKGVPGRLQEEFWKNGEVWQQTPIKFRTALRRHKKLGKWGIIKKVQGKYQDKRTFLSNGESVPLIID